MTGNILSLVIYRIVLMSLVLIYQLVAIVLGYKLLPFKGLLLIGVLMTGLTGVYLWFLRPGSRRDRNFSSFVFLQFTLDIAAISVMVVLTGGVTSSAHFLYPIVILLSAIFLEKISIYAMALLALSFYFLSLNFGPFLLPYEFPFLYIEEIGPQIRSATLGLFVLCFLTALLSAFMQTVYRTSREELDKKEARIRSLRVIRKKIVESLPSGLITCENNGNIIFVNRMGQKILQKKRDELVGVSVWQFFDFDPGPKPEAGLREPRSRIERKLLIDGARKHVGITFTTMEMETGKPGYMVMFQDLTKIKLLEEHKLLAERMSAIGKVASGVAHEIRTPLAAISGSVQVLKEMMPEDETAHELAGIVSRESIRLNTIISQFLAYARPGSPPDFKPVNLVECIEDFVRLTRNDAQLKSLKLTTRFNVPEIVILADQAKLSQVFWNLMRNSYEACGEEGEVEITCLREGENVKFIFRDNGIGMTEDQLKDIFTPFQSFRKSGTGLGMSIVFDVVQMHRASIEVASKVGEGTRVDITFKKYKE